MKLHLAYIPDEFLKAQEPSQKIFAHAMVCTGRNNDINDDDIRHQTVLMWPLF